MVHSHCSIGLFIDPIGRSIEVFTIRRLKTHIPRVGDIWAKPLITGLGAQGRQWLILNNITSLSLDPYNPEYGGTGSRCSHQYDLARLLQRQGKAFKRIAQFKVSFFSERHHPLSSINLQFIGN